MRKETAVDFFRNEIREVCFIPSADVYSVLIRLKEIYGKAKEMEKEQIMDAFNEGVDWHRDYFGKQKGMVKNLPDTYGGDHE